MSETADTATELRIRPLDELDLEGICAIDEKIAGRYRPEVWERRVAYTLRHDPLASLVAESEGQILGFMFGEVRSGEFGFDEPTGWIEVLGVDPEARGRAVGRRMAEAMLVHFKNRGAQRVRTLVDENRPDLVDFFGALGFAPASLKPFVKDL